MVVCRGAWRATDAGIRWIWAIAIDHLLLIVLQLEIAGCLVCVCVVRRQVESQTLPVVVNVVEHYDLPVTDDRHAARWRCVIRLVIYAIFRKAILQRVNTFRYIVVYIIAVQDWVVIDDAIALVALWGVIIQYCLCRWITTHRVDLGWENRFRNLAIRALLSGLSTSVKLYNESHFAIYTFYHLISSTFYSKSSFVFFATAEKCQFVNKKKDALEQMRKRAERQSWIFQYWLI